MLSQQVQSMTKTKSPIATPVPPPLPPTMENVHNASSASGATTTTPVTTPDLKMGAGVSANNSSTTNNSSNSGCGVGSVGTTTTTGRNETGSGNVEQAKLVNILPAVTQCTWYTPCYCEENVWKMCDKVRSDFPKELEYCHVAFISNKKRMVPMWRQKSGKNDEKLALWDYHVILLYTPDERCLVYDIDSELPFPTHFHRYVSETFRTENILQPEYHRFFRIIPASRFLSLFSSDRSHMLRQEDRSWIKPPPGYPPICSSGVNNLEQFINMTDPKNEFGEVFTLMELVRKFYKPRQLS